jgi:hypothetical protein
MPSLGTTQKCIENRNYKDVLSLHGLDLQAITTKCPCHLSSRCHFASVSTHKWKTQQQSTIFAGPFSRFCWIFRAKQCHLWLSLVQIFQDIWGLSLIKVTNFVTWAVSIMFGSIEIFNLFLHVLCTLEILILLVSLRGTKTNGVGSEPR